MQSLTNKQAAYDAALTAFKRHEALGWHHLSPFAVGASVEEATTIQEGIDTYHRLQEEHRVAKRRLKNARYKANRRARKEAEAEEDSDSESEGFSASAWASACDPRTLSSYLIAPSSGTESQGRSAQVPKKNEEVKEEDSDSDEDAVVPKEKAPASLTQYHDLVARSETASQAYFVSVADSWKSQNSTYRSATKHFRRFAVKNGQATFQVAKDGACYEEMPLDVTKLLVPGLRLWASVLRLPYASKMCRHELSVLLQPVLATLAQGPKLW
jgi:hypothetical protein